MGCPKRWWKSHSTLTATTQLTTPKIQGYSYSSNQIVESYYGWTLNTNTKYALQKNDMYLTMESNRIGIHRNGYYDMFRVTSSGLSLGINSDPTYH